MKKFTILAISLYLFSLLGFNNSFAQVTIGSADQPIRGSLLQLKNMDETSPGGANATKGLLLPRMILSKKHELYPMFLEDVENPNSGPTTNYETNKSTIDASHTGMIVYNIQENIDEVLCLGPNVWNGKEWNCLLRNIKYTMDCSSIEVFGTGLPGQSLNPTEHYITLDVIADTEANGAIYNIKTNTVDGIYFEGKGTLQAGTQTITLEGKGIPTGYNTKHFTISSNSQKSSATCSVDYLMAFSQKSVFAFGSFKNTAGYLGQEGSGLRKMLDAVNNFGATPDSKVKIERYSDTQTFNPHQNTTTITAAAIKPYLDAKPDIVMTGYDITNATTVPLLVDYLKNGGVLIFICEHATMATQFFKALYPDIASSITDGGMDGTIRLQLPSIDDEILNGPFGDLRGAYWGNDMGGTRFIKGIPADDIVAYTSGTKGVTMFKHKTYNLFFIGEGGFNANYNGGTGSNAGTTSTYAYPFAIDASFTPITRTNWTNGDVENSRLMGNIFAWAIYQAQFHGINAE